MTTVGTISLLLLILIISEDPVDNIVSPKPLAQPRYPVRAGSVQFRGEEERLQPFSPNPVQPKFSEDSHYIFSNNTPVILWIDVPNSFPWRKCLHEYSGMMFTYSCSLTSHKQIMMVRTVGRDGTRFRLVLGSGKGEHCVEPDRSGGVVRVVQECSDTGVWRWSSDALLEWSGGGCLASQNAQDKTVVAHCDKNYDDQIVEFGVVTSEAEKSVLAPIDLKHYL